MTRNRVVAAVALVGLVGVGLTLLAAAGQPTGKPSEPAKPTSTATDRLVCLGYVDTEDRMIGLFPDNFPQPSRVTKVMVREGDEVKKGDKLLELDAGLLALNVRAADNAIRAAKSELAKAESAVQGHAVQVAALEKKWKGKQAAVDAKQKELDETRQAVDVYKSKNRLDLEAAEAALSEAKLNLEAARIEWEGMKDLPPTYAVDLAKAGIEKAENLKSQAEKALAEMTCTAPDEGRIIRTFVSEGSSFGPTTREPAFWFLKKGSPLIRAEVTQEFSGRVTKGQSATITDESDDKLVWKGRVTKVGDQFLHKRQSNGSALDIFPVNDDRVLECIVSIDSASGQALPRFGQRVRISLEP